MIPTRATYAARVAREEMADLLEDERLARVERLLREACACAVAGDWTLKPSGLFDSFDHTCCGFGAFVVTCTPPGRSITARAALAIDILGIDEQARRAIERGFDHGSPCTPWEAIGARLRAEFAPVHP